MWYGSSSVVKISIAHFYTQLFPSSTFRRIAYTVSCLVVVNWIVSLLILFLLCRPLAYNWDKSIPGGKCGNVHAFWLSQSIVGLFFDVIVIALPMPMLWGLSMKRSRKLALMFVFGLGAL